MKESQVMTSPEKLDPKEILNEPNAEVRRELVRKVGIERFVYKSGAKTIDTFQEYQLLEITWPDGRKHRYLKMHNPSVPEVWHVEGVVLECQTVSEALHYRKPDAMRKIPIDNENGEEWMQQGDVCLWPDGAKSLKEFPSILT